MEIEEVINAHHESNVTTGLEVEKNIKVKGDKNSKLKAETLEENVKLRIDDETTTTEAEVYMTPESTESPGSAGSTRSMGSKGSKESKESKGSNGSKGSKISTKFKGYTGSIGSRGSTGSMESTATTGSKGSRGSTEAKLEGEENVMLETKNAEMAQQEADA